MNNMIWLARAVRWVKNPPSDGRVALVVGVIVAAVVIATLGWLGWWPDWATMEHGRGVRLPRP